MANTIRLTTPGNYAPRIQTEAPRLKIDHPEHRFRLVHFAHQWSYDDEFGWLPETTKIFEMPGGNGISKVNPNSTAPASQNPAVMSGSLSELEKKGAVEIKYTDLKVVRWFGERFKDVDGNPTPTAFYANGYPCENGKIHYCMPWERPTQVTRLSVIWNVKDSARWDREFRKFLRDEQIVAPMADELKGQIALIMEQNVERRINAHSDWESNAARKRIIDRERALIAKIRAELEGDMVDLPEMRPTVDKIIDTAFAPEQEKPKGKPGPKPKARVEEQTHVG